MTPSFPLIEVSGPPLERGIQYGEQAKKQIAEGVTLYRKAFSNAGISWKKAQGLAAKFTPEVAVYDKDMVDEIHGIAIGSNQPMENIVILNARTELMFWEDNNTEVQPNGPQEECTALLALPEKTHNGHLLHGQNWDWNPDCANSSVVLKITGQDGPDILTFVEAGQLARHGMNSNGIALTANGLQSDIDCGTLGTPNPLIRRRILQSNTLGEALQPVLNDSISFSHNLMISHREGIAYSLEATPKKVYWLPPENGILTHSNHFKSIVAQVELEDVCLQRCPESLYRDLRVEQALKKAGNAVTIDTFKNALADTFGAPDAVLRTPKLRPGGNLSGTVASIIMDTTAGKMLIAPTPYTGEATFTEYSL